MEEQRQRQDGGSKPEGTGGTTETPQATTTSGVTDTAGAESMLMNSMYPSVST